MKKKKEEMRDFLQIMSLDGSRLLGKKKLTAFKNGKLDRSLFSGVLDNSLDSINKNVWLRFGAIAACLCVIVAVATIWPILNSDQSNPNDQFIPTTPDKLKLVGDVLRTGDTTTRGAFRPLIF